MGDVTQRLDSLTALRFFAAFVVFGYHANVLLVGTASGIGSFVFGGGQSGVTFFFTLSGFVLAWSAKATDTPRRFYWRRFARIYPAYLASLVAGAVLVALSAPSKLSTLWAPVLLVQAWIPDPDVILAINVPAWSLSCEAFFYLAFPFFIGALTRMSTRNRWLAITSLWATLILGAAITSLAQAYFPFSFVPEWITGFLPLSRLPEFIIGALLALQIRAKAVPRTPFWVGAVLSVGAVLWGSFDPTQFSISAIPIVPFLMLISSAAQRDIGRSATVLRSKIIVGLGSWSYCFYLVHVLCLAVVHTVLKHFGMALFFEGWGAWITVLALSLLVAALLHRIVELPVNRFLTRSQTPSIAVEGTHIR
jgi:peptidoglycan/LPS O-acetylase OafA/YrhL